MTKSKAFPHIIGGIAALVLAFLYCYFLCPAINVQNPGLWVLIALMALVYLLGYSLCGGGGGETVNVEIVSPSLKKAAKWNSLGEWAFKRLDEEGLWSIRFSKPDAGVYEDTFATVVGDSPSLIFLSAEKYWK